MNSSTPIVTDATVTNDVGEKISNNAETAFVRIEPSTKTKVPDTKTQVKTPPKKTHPNRKPLILAILGIGAIAAGRVGYNWWQYASTHQETDNATVTGRVHPVSSRISGTVQQILVNDNQLVKKGQLLVKLDPRDYKIRFQQAQADLDAAKSKANTAKVNIDLAAKNAQASNAQAQGNVNSSIAAIANAEAQVNAAKAGIPKAQDQLAQEEANLENARTEYDRNNNLYRSGAISRQTLDRARQAYRVALAQRDAEKEGIRQAQAQLAQAQQGVANAQAGLETARGGIQEANAKNIQTQVNRSDYTTAQTAIDQAQAALNNAQLQLSYTNIAAPTNGRIGNRTVEIGQQVAVGTPLMAVVNNDYWITANFKETQLENMRLGQLVEIKLDAFPHHTFIGRVDSISPASGATFALLPPDNATGNFTKIVQRIPVKIVFDRNSIKGYESAIAPGMSAVVSVNIK
jgi:membrane fusion protein (multidrug efflux system)